MFTLNCNGRVLIIDQPVVMGIINVTPDSFYSDSRKLVLDDALALADKMIAEGATIVDIGGQSTRPGSEVINEDEELKRVLPVIDAIRKKFPQIFISIDTYYASVARESVDMGADIVNDISAGALDKKLIQTVAALKVPYVLMHMKGTPQTMNQLQHYENVTVEVFEFFQRKIQILKDLGIEDLIIDPGFGFAKNTSQNFELLSSLESFTKLKQPILTGVSRKGMIYRTLEIDPSKALNGSSVLHTVALMKGTSILRVHDVKPAMEAIKLLQHIDK